MKFISIKCVMKNLGIVERELGIILVTFFGKNLFFRVSQRKIIAYIEEFSVSTKRNVKAMQVHDVDLLELMDQVHKFPHVGKFMHLIQKVAILHSLPVYTAPYIYIPGLPLQCTLPFF